VYFYRRNVGGGVVECRNPASLSDLRELFVFDLPHVVIGVVEEHHRGLLVDSPLHLVPRLHFNHPHATRANRVVVAEAMGSLRDDLALHALQVWQTGDLFPVRAREHGGRSKGQRCGRSRCHHRRFGAHQRSDALANAIVELVEHHVVLGGILDGIHHFRRHERGGHGGVGSRRVDKWADAHLTEVVAFGCERGDGR
jgi:hypothetical protein